MFKKISIVLALVLICFGIASSNLAFATEDKILQHIVFVGDDSLSTMSKMTDDFERFTWLYKKRKGITWIQSKEEEFLKYLRKNDVLVFAIGLSEVSSSSKANAHLSYYNNLSKRLNKKGIQFYIKSIDPVDEVKYGIKANDNIIKWNKKIKGGLDESIKYIDTHSILSQGFNTLANGYYYDEQTTQKVFDYILKAVSVPTDLEIREQRAALKDLSEVATGYWGKDRLGKKVFYDENKEIVKNTFKDVDGATYYFDNNGYYLTGLQTINNETMFFNSAGILVRNKTAKVDEDGNLMLFDKDGKQVVGKWKEVDGKTYYIDPNGFALTGWWTLGTTDYYFTKDGSVAKGIVFIEDGYYWFSNEGVAKVGWLEEGSDRYYFGQGGRMLTGHQEIAGKRYHFKENGQLSKGWFKDDSGKYYFDDETGEGAVGQKVIDGKNYFFTKEAKLKLGWIDEKGKKYFYKEDGDTYEGHTKIDNDYYYFNEDGCAQKGWIGKGRFKRYYSPSDYTMSINWKTIKGDKYYFNKKGYYLTGNHKIDGSYRFFRANGKLWLSTPVLLVNLLVMGIISVISIVFYRQYKTEINHYIEKVMRR